MDGGIKKLRGGTGNDCGAGVGGQSENINETHQTEQTQLFF